MNTYNLHKPEILAHLSCFHIKKTFIIDTLNQISFSYIQMGPYSY